MTVLQQWQPLAVLGRSHKQLEPKDQLDPVENRERQRMEVLRNKAEPLDQASLKARILSWPLSCTGQPSVFTVSAVAASSP